jgi:hypothetical protein
MKGTEAKFAHFLLLQIGSSKGTKWNGRKCTLGPSGYKRKELEEKFTLRKASYVVVYIYYCCEN